MWNFLFFGNVLWIPFLLLLLLHVNIHLWITALVLVKCPQHL